MKPTVAIIIIHYGSLTNVRECLESLKKSTGSGNFIPVIVDNAAAEPAEVLLSEFPDWLYVLRLPKNLGFAGGNNAGVKFALEKIQPRTVVLLNDDTTVDPEAIRTLDETLHANDHYGAVVPKIYFSAGREFHSGYQKEELGKVLWFAGGQIDWTEVAGFHRGVDEVDRGQYDRLEPTPFATGCCIAVRPKLWQKLRGFDERYFLYLEDMDLSRRIQRAGCQTIYQPQAVIWHKNAGSSGAGSALHQYYQTRNRYLFGFRYAPWRTRLFLAKQLFQQFRSGNQAVRRGILDFIRQRYGKRSNYHHD